MNIDSLAGIRQDIPLAQLVLSPLNVRKTGGTDIDELAASIAAQGLLQNLIVIESPRSRKASRKTAPTYEVVAGGRRWRALQRLLTEGQLSADTLITCRCVTREAALLASTAENSGREPLHPADQAGAILALVQEGRSIEDVEARFGITPLTVQRRLKLARVSPALLAIYRDDGMTLDQLMALAISDDPATQERVWNGASPWERQPGQLRRQLLGGALSSQHPRVRFVGLQAYEAAGGLVRRDLFAEADEGHVDDVGLLNDLAHDKLEAAAESVRSEGWNWVSTPLSGSYDERRGYTRVHPQRRAPTDDEARIGNELEARRATLQAEVDRLDDADGDDAEAADREADRRLEDVTDDLERFEVTLRIWTPETLAIAGAVVTLDCDGRLDVQRGWVKPEDRSRIESPAGVGPDSADEYGAHRTPTSPSAPGRKAHSEALVRRLTAHRTRAVQRLVADNGQVALAALAHTLIQQVLSPALRGRSAALDLRATPTAHTLTQAADDLPGTPAWTDLQERIEAWGIVCPAIRSGCSAG